MMMKQENLDNNSEDHGSSDSSSLKRPAPLTQNRQQLTFFEGAFVKNHDIKKQYYFKPKPLIRAQWEAYCAAIHQLIVTPHYVPSYKAYKGSVDPMEQWGDDLIALIRNAFTDRSGFLMKLLSGELFLKFFIKPTDEMHGVASKAIDFVSSADAPLREEDLIMRCQPFFNAFMSTKIKRMLTEPTRRLEEDWQQRSLAQRVVVFFSLPNTPLELYREILTSLDFATPKMIRKWHENPLCPEELKLLFNGWMNHDIKEEHLNLSIPVFEQFDAQYPSFEPDQTLRCSFKGKEYSISSTLLYQYKLIKGQGRTGIVRWIYQDWDSNKSNGSKKGEMVDFEYSKMNVLMRRVFWEPYIKLIVKIQQELGLPPEDIVREENFHGFNIQMFKFLGFEHEPANPELITRFPDLGDKEQYVHYHSTKRHYFNRALFGFITAFLTEFKNSKIKDTVFTKFITALLPSLVDDAELESNFISKFSDVCHLGYFTIKELLSGNPEVDLWKREVLFTRLLHKWDTFYKQNQDIFEYIEEYLLEMVGSKNKAFTKEDNEVNQLLSEHPVYIYHKNVSLLKYVLTSREQYRAYTELYFDQDNTKEELVEDEVSSIREWQHTAINTEQFQQFIINHGDEAMEIILREFAETKTKFQSKMTKKPEYKQIIDSLDLEDIQQKYLALKEEILSIVDSSHKDELAIRIAEVDEEEEESYSY